LAGWLVGSRSAVSCAQRARIASALPMIGGGQPVSEAVTMLEKADAAVVLIDGKPRGVLTRQDLLGFLS